MNRWELPLHLTVGGKNYPINGDFRDILEIIAYLDDQNLPEFIRWQVALALFYEGQIPEEHAPEAMEKLAVFLNGGAQVTGRPGPRLLDWQQDCGAIVSDVNRVAGQEIRGLKFLHWWTFLSWFHGVGEGQLSTLVAIRERLACGKKLEDWQQEFYRKNREAVALKKHYSPDELRHRAELNRLLNGE